MGQVQSAAGDVLDGWPCQQVHPSLEQYSERTTLRNAYCCHRCRPVFCTACSFLTVCKHLGSKRIMHIRSAFLLVTPGILGSQARPACTHRQL